MNFALRHFRTEQLLYWRSRELAFFTFALPIVFFVLLVAVRGLPILVVYRRALPPRQRVQLMLLSATTLPLLVALTQIGISTAPPPTCRQAPTSAGNAVTRRMASPPPGLRSRATPSRIAEGWVVAYSRASRRMSSAGIPVIVATADHHSYPGLAPSEEARLNDVWNAGQARWASLASSAQLISVSNTGHNIQLDRPEVVVDKIHELLQ